MRLVCLASLVLLTVSVGSCTRVNAQYCDEQTPCSTGSCDYETRSCLQDDGGGPADAAPDAMMCESSAVCSGTAPICDEDELLCRGCEPSGGDAPECEALDPATPQCNDDGRCVECASNDACGGVTPICDDDGRECRSCAMSSECTEPGSGTCAPDGACVGCVEHADCPASDVCDVRSRQCAEVASVVYVGGVAAADNPTCGISDLPCATVQYALDNKVTANRDIVRLATGNYDDAVINNIDVLVTGPAATLRGAASGDPVLEVTSGADAYLDGVGIRSGYGSSSAHGVRCNGTDSTLTLRNVEVRLNEGRGIDSDCDLTIIGGMVDGNGGSAINITGGTVRLEALEVTGNQGGGLNIQGAGFHVVNSIIAINGSPQASVGGVRIANFDTLSPQVLAFNTVADNITSDSTPAYGISCDVVNGSPSIFRSNIVWGGSGPDESVSGNCPFTYSNITGGLSGEGNLDTDPKFVGSGDYHLMSDSPVVDKGSPVPDVDRDIDGDLRDDEPDIGADEL